MPALSFHIDATNAPAAAMMRTHSHGSSCSSAKYCGGNFLEVVSKVEGGTPDRSNP